MGAAPEGPEEAPPVPPAKPARKPRAKAKTSAKAPPAAPTPELAAPSSEIPEKAPETGGPSNPQAFGLADITRNRAQLVSLTLPTVTLMRVSKTKVTNMR